MAAMSEDVKSNGASERIHIRYDDDPEGRRARSQCIMHDTGADCSLKFESKLKSLGLPFEPVSSMPDLVSVVGEKFRPIGRRQICFTYAKRPSKLYWADVLVLSDPENGKEPNFDFLFGRDTIQKIMPIGWDYSVIGHRAFLGSWSFPRRWLHKICEFQIF